MPAACAIAATAGMSSTSRPGLPMVSPITRRVSAGSRRGMPSRSRGLTKRRRDAEARQRVRQQVDGAAIERRGGDDVIAGAEQRRDGDVHRRHAARRAHRADAALQRRQALLEHRRRRIRDPAVDVARPLQVEQRRGLIGIVEDVGRRLIDRHGARAVHRIRMLAGMQAQGVEPGRFGRGHQSTPRCGRRLRPGGWPAIAAVDILPVRCSAPLLGCIGHQGASRRRPVPSRCHPAVAQRFRRHRGLRWMTSGRADCGH